MNRKMYWGIAALIVVLIAGGGFIYYQWSSVQQLKEELAQDEKMLEENDKPVAENKPPPARPGNKLVPHGDHFHEVPIDAPDTWNDAAPAPVAKDKPVVQTPVTTYTGPLTFHAELLKTNPVKALRLQAEERGHVNAKWIPPFPPDDTEAQELAKAVYAFIYNTNSDTPKLGIGGNDMLMMMEIDKKYARTSARHNDLQRLTWVALDFPMGQYNLPSDYFPSHISEVK